MVQLSINDVPGVRLKRNAAAKLREHFWKYGVLFEYRTRYQFILDTDTCFSDKRYSPLSTATVRDTRIFDYVQSCY